MRKILASFTLLLSSFAIAQPTVTGNIVTFPESQWWQVEIPWDQGGGVVCNKADTDICTLEPGTYKWILDGEEGNLTINEPAANQPLVVRNSCQVTSLNEVVIDLELTNASCSVSCPSGMVISIESYSRFPEVDVDTTTPQGLAFPGTVNFGLGTSTAYAYLYGLGEEPDDLVWPNQVEVVAVCL